MHKKTNDNPRGQTLGAARSGARRRLFPARPGAVVVVVVALSAVVYGAGAARAESTFPPIPVFPAAGETAPPAGAISDPSWTDATCSGWYLQTSYVGQPTGSTWWEYYCHHEWPPLGTGASDWDGLELYDDYFYWDGSAPVFYGQWSWVVYSDWFGSGCPYWWDASGSYGPLDESFGPIDCG
jgi:hypothetical protein